MLARVEQCRSSKTKDEQQPRQLVSLEASELQPVVLLNRRLLRICKATR